MAERNRHQIRPGLSSLHSNFHSLTKSSRATIVSRSVCMSVRYRFPHHGISVTLVSTTPHIRISCHFLVRSEWIDGGAVH